MKKSIAVLGATGSIGSSALDVIRSERDLYEPVLLSCHRKISELLALSQEFPKALLVFTGEGAVPQGCYCGIAGLREAIAKASPAIGINGIAGAAGLLPSIMLLEANADLALANKETIVMAAPLVKGLAAQRGCAILPVDSEHAAIFALLHAHGREAVKELLITASGGPFRNAQEEDLKRITPEEALAHPTWSMGPKISIDSATLANKGLEVIEAAHLFDFSPSDITVVIHPQSMVHSMVRLKNGAIYGELSSPDMRLPIHNALSYPNCTPCSFGALDFNGLTLEFYKPDGAMFPMLPLAFEALRQGGEYPIVYNAANEVAVTAFLENSIGFLDISQIVSYVFDRSWASAASGMALGDTGVDIHSSLEAIMETDRKARSLAEDRIRERQWQ